MESGSHLGTYVAYGFVCLFLVIVALAVLRSSTMVIALLTLPFLRDKAAKGPGDPGQPAGKPDQSA
jgi:hypothetical protein